MKKKIILLILCLSVLPGLSYAQGAYEEESVFSDYLNPVSQPSFLRVPGLGFSSSIGFSYSSYGNYGSDGFGFYMGHFNYSLGSKVTLAWDVGIRSSMTGPDAGGDPQFFLPNLDLTYKPNDRMMLKFQVRQYGYMQSPWLMRR